MQNVNNYENKIRFTQYLKTKLAQTHFNSMIFLFFFYFCFTHLKNSQSQKRQGEMTKRKYFFMTFCLEPRKSTDSFSPGKEKNFFFLLLHSYCVSRLANFNIQNAASNNKIHVMLTPNWRKKTKIVIFFSSYFHMILFFFLLLLCVLSLAWSVYDFRRWRSFAVYYFIHFTSASYWIIWLLRHSERVWFHGSMVLIQRYAHVLVCAIIQIYITNTIYTYRTMCMGLFFFGWFILTVYALKWVRERQIEVLDVCNLYMTRLRVYVLRHSSSNSNSMTSDIW